MSAVAILFSLFGCISGNAEVSNRQDYLNYFRMSITEQIKQFKKYSLDEQYNLFLFGNQVMHPPAIYLAHTFAEQGPQVIPLLQKKLKVTQDELTIRDITAVFLEFSRLKTYDFSKDADLMKLLKKKTGDMHEGWKKVTLEMVSEIES
ncbi:hypothetical protein ACO0LM_02420 [Undibacterium sp. Di26W]|uniref:hypothetical protein n=1 Tax=Undibacterium sp. Di26W TaxID=3413035 RepID=UPI003BF32F3F